MKWCFFQRKSSFSTFKWHKPGSFISNEHKNTLRPFGKISSSSHLLSAEFHAAIFINAGNGQCSSSLRAARVLGITVTSSALSAAMRGQLATSTEIYFKALLNRVFPSMPIQSRASGKIMCKGSEFMVDLPFTVPAKATGFKHGWGELSHFILAGANANT